VDNFITLTCPTCGGKLQITDDIERFACAHCGNEHIVKRGGGVITLAPVTESLNHIKVGVDKTASELAIKRVKEEIAEIEKNEKSRS
jgi:DNA-directed RNA polymerase subunit RPC12/RpoP